MNGRDNKTDPVKSQLQKQRNTADHPEFCAIQRDQTSSVTDKKFIGACPAFRCKLRNAQIKRDQPAKYRHALGTAHQLQARLPACHWHVLEEPDGGQRLQKIARHHKIHGPAADKPQQHQYKPQHSPKLCFCIKQLDPFRFSLHQHDCHLPPAP